jgi:hypothetical protein
LAQTWNERDIPACVYTVLTGNYETLNEQPALKECGLPCICLTDNPQLTSDVWEIRPLNSVFPWDPIRSQRDAKLQPHLYLPEFKASLYIDNALVLKRPPEELLSEFYTANQSVFIEHSFRASLFDEFREIMQTGLDDSARIFEQFNHYKASDISLFEAPLIWTAIMIRDHTADHFEQFCHTWSAHIMRYTRRDQLSVLAALRQSGHAYALKALDNYDSAWHSWPVAPGRKSERRRNGGGLFETEFRLETRRLQGELDSLQLRWDELQAAFDIQSAAHEHLIKKYHDLLDEHRAVISAFENSTSWKVTRPLRTLISLLKR